MTGLGLVAHVLSLPRVHRPLGAAAVIGLVLTLAYCHVREDVANDLDREISTHNQRSVDAAQEGLRAVNRCFDAEGTWNDETSRCDY